MIAVGIKYVSKHHCGYDDTCNCGNYAPVVYFKQSASIITTQSDIRGSIQWDFQL
jgi:hypothetical protein